MDEITSTDRLLSTSDCCNEAVDCVTNTTQLNTTQYFQCSKCKKHCIPMHKGVRMDVVHKCNDKCNCRKNEHDEECDDFADAIDYNDGWNDALEAVMEIFYSTPTPHDSDTAMAMSEMESKLLTLKK